MYGAGGFSYISPCGIYESYFLYIILLVVNIVKLRKKLHIISTMRLQVRKQMAHKKGYSVYHSDITATKKKDGKMRDEKRESDEEESK